MELLSERGREEEEKGPLSSGVNLTWKPAGGGGGATETSHHFKPARSDFPRYLSAFC